MAKKKKLEKEEMDKLFRQYSETKDTKIRDILIEENLYIAEILAKRYINRGIEFDDIFQVASMGLIYAVERFDIEKGYQFSSFATPTIVGEIRKHFRDKGWTIRVPRRVQELSKDINLAMEELSQSYQRAPTIKDLADHLEVSEEEILETMEASQVYSPQSLDQTYDSYGDETHFSLEDLLGEEDIHFDKIEDYDLLANTMGILNELEIQILKDRFFHEKTQAKIAEELDISQMTVSRLERKIIERLQKEALK